MPSHVNGCAADLWAGQSSRLEAPFGCFADVATAFILIVYAPPPSLKGISGRGGNEGDHRVCGRSRKTTAPLHLSTRYEAISSGGDDIGGSDSQGFSGAAGSAHRNRHQQSHNHHCRHRVIPSGFKRRRPSSASSSPSVSVHKARRRRLSTSSSSSSSSTTAATTTSSSFSRSGAVNVSPEIFFSLATF
ncbi:unnamed protein product [Hydatigera taeniaeformis]|uniref:Uncharacterized protein n=1 Tax=Hydatigena taeniaeformis TaxID=6205 RepID=A0A0R3WP43_HYDTA|nr:unnamed protein product [Hydatigera taeniaeformis]